MFKPLEGYKLNDASTWSLILFFPILTDLVSLSTLRSPSSFFDLRHVVLPRIPSLRCLRRSWYASLTPHTHLNN